MWVFPLSFLSSGCSMVEGGLANRISLFDRSPNSRKKTISEISSSASAASLGFSWPRIEKRGGRRVLRLSALRTGVTLQGRARGSMAVSAPTPLCLLSVAYLFD